MTIQNTTPGPVHSNSARSDEAGKAHEAPDSENAKTNEATEAEDASARDQVEISDEARAAHSELGGEDAALVERGRQALRESGLTEERVATLRERVEQGYYTEPEVTEEIAEGLAQDLGRAAQ